MSTKGNLLTFGLAGGAALVLLSGIASAAPRDIEITARAVDPDLRVEYVLHRDLNLASAADRKALKTRVSQAVGRVCEPYEPPLVSMDYNRCRRGAWDGAEAQIDVAIRRAEQIAATGSSTLPAVAIAIAGRRNP